MLTNPTPQRFKIVLCVLAVVGVMSVAGCETKPAENPAQKAPQGKLPTPPPQVQIGPPGQNPPPPAR